MTFSLFEGFRSGVVACWGNALRQISSFLLPLISRLHCVGAPLGTALVLTMSMSSVGAAEQFSQAERTLFMTNHLGALVTPATLQYMFRKSGSLEENFEDKVTITVKAQTKAQCCIASTEFLGGARRLTLPEVEPALGNPVILHFLERDIREMQRLTKGQPNYFRKRIRMAVFQGAKISDIEVPYGGKMIAARQITIAPYTADPLRPRYEKLADKHYIFTLSADVPGEVYAIRSRVDGASPTEPPLLVEELVLDPATAASSRRSSGTPKQ